MCKDTTRAPRVLAALALAAAAGCGGTGGAGSPRAASASAPAGGLAAASTATPAAAQVGVSGSAVSVGDTVEVHVDWPATGPEIYGAGFDLRYDPAVLEVLTANPGGLLAGAEARLALRGGRPGVAVVAITKEGPVPGDRGPGRLLVLRLKALRAGTSKVEFAEGVAVDGQGLARPLVLAAATVAVR